MTCSPHIFELTLSLDTKKFNKLLNKAYDKSKYQLYQDNDKHTDYALTSKGIQIIYHDDIYKKKVKLIVNPSRVLGTNDIPWIWKPNNRNISDLLRKLEKRIGDYFGYKYKLNDFKLTSIDFAVNARFEDKDKVSAYVKTLQRIGKVKGFSPVTYKWIDKDIGFSLEGNSNGIEFTAYDKEKQLKKQLKNSQQKESDAIIKRAKGILRIEVRLTEQKAIRAYTYETVTSKQIADLSKKSMEIFTEIIIRIVPFGEFQKKGKAVEIIENKITNKTLRKKMIELLELIPKKKSLLLAQKALNYRRMDCVMEMFNSIELSPITISKRHDVKKLKNLYRYFED